MHITPLWPCTTAADSVLDILISTYAKHLKEIIMKSTKVQNPRRIASRLVHYANARARKLTTPRVVAVTRGVLSVLAPTRASGFVLGKADVVDNHWASWVFPCGSASITVNTNTHAHHFCYEEKWPPKCMEHYCDPARSQQRSIFRENPTNFLTFVAR